MMKDHYSPEEVDEILASALTKQSLPGDMNREQLIQLAGELGITPEQLSEAETECRVRSPREGNPLAHPWAEPDLSPLRDQYREYRTRVMAAVRILIVLLTVSVLLGGSPNLADQEDVLSVLAMAGVVALVFVATFVKGSGPIRERSFRRWLRRRELLDNFRSRRTFNRLR